LQFFIKSRLTARNCGKCNWCLNKSGKTDEETESIKEMREERDLEIDKWNGKKTEGKKIIKEDQTTKKTKKNTAKKIRRLHGIKQVLSRRQQGYNEREENVLNYVMIIQSSLEEEKREEE